MPAFPGSSSPVNVSQASMTFRSAGGDQGSVSVKTGATATQVQVAAMWDAIANVSNAGLFKRSFNTADQIPIAEVVAYDEAHSAISTRLVLVYQNGLLDSLHVPIPAPDQAYFNGDGVGFNSVYPGDADHPSSAVLLSAISAVINAGATGTEVYTFVRGYRSQYKQRLQKPRVGELAVEPIADTPPG